MIAVLTALKKKHEEVKLFIEILLSIMFIAANQGVPKYAGPQDCHCLHNLTNLGDLSLTKT